MEAQRNAALTRTPACAEAAKKKSASEVFNLINIILHLHKRAVTRESAARLSVKITRTAWAYIYVRLQF